MTIKLVFVASPLTIKEKEHKKTLNINNKQPLGSYQDFWKI
jgi:hypothetical protein